MQATMWCSGREGPARAPWSRRPCGESSRGGSRKGSRVTGLGLEAGLVVRGPFGRFLGLAARPWENPGVLRALEVALTTKQDPL